jgi:hypothetical protein
MRASANELKEALNAYLCAITPTTALTHRLAIAFAQHMANRLGGAVRITLPGNVAIERGPQEQTTVARFARR